MKQSRKRYRLIHRRWRSQRGLKGLRAIQSEFVKKGWIKEPKRQSKQSESAGAFRKYTSPDGFQIYVGRNSKENDLLLRRIASSRDMWLHAKQIHGSHVIIRNPEKKPGIPMPTLLKAAQIAAFFSKAQHSSYVPVDYTWFRYVVKPKGNRFRLRDLHPRKDVAC